MAMEEVVAEHQSGWRFSEVGADQEGLGQSIGAGLHGYWMDIPQALPSPSKRWKAA